ncbi:AAA family ATPase [Agathobaculum sp. Marseille-P7918]|uniref:AAA family ATPase n=1 Tax=Agathobaculum sp. Marseille-P7918 TaxID=2479843 RepID=UPI000F6374DF|nr:ATP-binding protein [Agathobaculum sp. Marseille-P7918]
MLLWFRFKNYGPFHEEAFFDMRAVNAYKELPDHVMQAGNQNVVKTAAIYGANASGKSNFIKAIECFRNMILYSMSNTSEHVNPIIDLKEDRALRKYYTPFQFDQNSSHEPTEFEACVSLFGVEYQYGFTYDEFSIQYEWLYINKKEGKQEVVFERDVTSGIEFGEKVDHECKKYVPGLKDQVLLLTFFYQIKLPDTVWTHARLACTSLFVWDVSRANMSQEWVSIRLEDELQKERAKKRLISYLNQIDVNIVDFEMYQQDNRDLQVYTIHVDDSGNRYLMPLEKESAGTIKALALYLIVGNEMSYECTYVFDEMNAHLHPLLTKYFVNRFYENGANEQLIFATHDVNLLDKKYMRRDQVWFVEKIGNESKLFSLADFKVRNDASLRKNYLAGNYGAIPILGENVE